MATPKKKISKTPDKVAFSKLSPGERSIEQLSHFWCLHCKKWWSIGDAPRAKKEWFCPWCGVPHKYK